MTVNLHSHSTSDLSRNHKVLDELTSLVEQVCDSTSTEVSTERCAFTPRVLSPEEIKQADDAFHFDLRSDFDETEFEEEADER